MYRVYCRHPSAISLLAPNTVLPIGPNLHLRGVGFKIWAILFCVGIPAYPLSEDKTRSSSIVTLRISVQRALLARPSYHHLTNIFLQIPPSVQKLTVAGFPVCVLEGKFGEKPNQLESGGRGRSTSYTGLMRGWAV